MATLLPVPRPDKVADAAANAFDMVFKGGVADLRRTPAKIIDEAPKRTVYRYVGGGGDLRPKGLPVLLVPPLAAPTICFDLRRGCSMAEHMLATGHRTYLVEYGHIGYSDKELGLEHWVEDIIPNAIRAASEDAGGKPVQLVGWCLGGIMSLLSVAGDKDLPVERVAMVASPFDFTKVRLMAPIRPVANLTNGLLLGSLIRALGGAPAPIVKRAFQLSSIDKYVTKPWAVASNLHDRDFLAQIEAVDNFTDNMHAYPGRTIGQLYHRFFRVNELAGGSLDIPGRTIELGDVKVPVLSVAGAADVLAPRPAVHAVADLLPNAPQVRLETAPGGHLGVLTGRSAKHTTWKHLDRFLGEGARAADPVQRPLRVVA
jgi:polyhydroxyalkanoate synthase